MGEYISVDPYLYTRRRAPAPPPPPHVFISGRATGEKLATCAHVAKNILVHKKTANKSEWEYFRMSPIAPSPVRERHFKRQRQSKAE
jgi:hypothetical protein